MTAYISYYVGIPPQVLHLFVDPLDLFREIVANSSESDFIKNQHAVFNNKYSVHLSEAQIGNSLGYSFNLLSAEDLFHVNE